ncbi:proline-rich transmembrane protein 2-like [Mercenaria mercenaria]|uniref:proline-rich transmembrane protein 2-like n=1 Tax=Mercenaria mercenaria TaxID=6596 RepID=UPI001E1DC7E7|nr:proline-rich transmembrane protein 2-like [Mercenaria mercenaria]
MENKGYDQQGPPPAYNQPPAVAYQGQPAGYQGQPAEGYQPQGYGQPPQTVVVTQTGPIVPRPPDYLIPSIVACFCFWPTGLFALKYALRANSLVGQGDMPGAQAASNTARTLMIVSIVVGVVWVGIVIILSATGTLETYSYRTHAYRTY